MKNNRDWWEAEAQYCADIARPRDLEKSFNGDAECFYDYCAMQSRAAKWDGFQDIADRIQDAGSSIL